MRNSAAVLATLAGGGVCFLVASFLRRRRRAEFELTLLGAAYGAANGSADVAEAGAASNSSSSSASARAPPAAPRSAPRSQPRKPPSAARAPTQPFAVRAGPRMDVQQCRKQGKWNFEFDWVDTGMRCLPRSAPPCHGPPLRQFEPTDAQSCLRGKRLLIVGDSLSRYAMTQLSYAVQTGQKYPPRGKHHVDNRTNTRWPPERIRCWLLAQKQKPIWVRGMKRKSRPLKCPSQSPTYGAAGKAGKSLLWEGAYSTWKEYYFDLVRTFQGHMCCDCYRKVNAAGDVAGGSGETFLDPEINTFSVYRENLYFNAPAPQQDTEISFSFLKGDLGWMNDGRMEWREGCPGQLGPNSTDYDYRRQGADVVLDLRRQKVNFLDWDEFGRRLRREPAPRLYDAAVLSPGFWTGNWRYNKTHVMGLASAVSSALKPGAPKLYYLRDLDDTYLEMARWLADSGWLVVDAGPFIHKLLQWGPDRQFFSHVDTMHLQPWATVELNNILLSELCPRPE
eukprot:TRINITY_DN14296_c0_g2_i1.p1 TRINITY_DN14296_c0_g2~~TRINITY_DN14296_c0_g2_i1.p1  ORF type:complete len:506 (+),score=38.04 TRINITY_DN14296_c0_g2_i1:98-1615(+)